MYLCITNMHIHIHKYVSIYLDVSIYINIYIYILSYIICKYVYIYFQYLGSTNHCMCKQIFPTPPGRPRSRCSKKPMQWKEELQSGHIQNREGWSQPLPERWAQKTSQISRRFDPNGIHGTRMYIQLNKNEPICR